MCNLHASTLPRDAMLQIFKAHDRNNRLGNAEPLPAIYPKGMAPIVRMEEGEREMARSMWGFLTPKKSEKTGNWIKPTAWNNTRDDKIRSAPLWRDSFENRRCLIPGTSYAEATGKRPATWHWFRPKDTEGFAFAGIWKHQGPVPGAEDTDTIAHSMVTTTPNNFASKYHNRMPVILPPEAWEQWLTGNTADAVELLVPYFGEMELLGSGVDLKSEPA